MQRRILQLLMKIICPFFIWNKEKRKEFIRHHSRITVSFCSFANLKRFKNDPVLENSVLILEPNDFHGEVMPGYAEYFLKLGFNVDVVSVPALMKTKFLPQEQLKKIRAYAVDEVFYKKILHDAKSKFYKYILFTSVDGMHGPVTRYIPNDAYSKLFAVLHSKEHLRKKEIKKLYDDKKLFVLRNFNNDKNLWEINPHYFGQNKPADIKNHPVNFIMVGLIDPKKRNSQLMIDSIANLAAKSEIPFKLTVISRRKIKNVPKSTSQYLNIRYNLDYDKMYEEMKRAHFFLPLLDPKNEKQRAYLSELSTGSPQLIMGFLTPAIINNEYAKTYFLNSENSVLYKDNELAPAMLAALNMTAETYNNMTQELKTMQQERFNSSLNNLKKALHG